MLAQAAKDGDCARVAELLSAADADADQLQGALRCAKDEAVAELLLDAGADPNAEGLLRHVALRQSDDDHARVVCSLMRRGAAVDQDTLTAVAEHISEVHCEPGRFESGMLRLWRQMQLEGNAVTLDQLLQAWEGDPGAAVGDALSAPCLLELSAELGLLANLRAFLALPDPPASPPPPPPPPPAEQLSFVGRLWAMLRPPTPPPPSPRVLVRRTVGSTLNGLLLDAAESEELGAVQLLLRAGAQLDPEEEAGDEAVAVIRLVRWREERRAERHALLLCAPGLRPFLPQRVVREVVSFL